MTSTASIEIIDAPLIKVPFESLKRAAKDRKTLIDEAAEATASLKEAPKDAGAEEHLANLELLLSKLQGIKRKIDDVSKAEKDEAQRCKSRLDHLKAIGLPKDSVIAWNKHRMDRILIDHLHRSVKSARLFISIAVPETLSLALVCHLGGHAMQPPHGLCMVCVTIQNWNAVLTVSLACKRSADNSVF